MSRLYRGLLLAVLALLLVSCTTPAVSQPTISGGNQPSLSTPTQTDPENSSEAHIVRQPAPFDFSGYYVELDSVPKYDPGLGEQGQVELRSRDLSKIDMTASLADLMYAIFDSKTQWPPADKMPAGFDPQKIMEIGKDPGLGMRVLHEQGITGKGVGIAIVDQPLLVDH